MADTKFLPGFFFDRPREGAPAFVKGRMSIRVEDAILFLDANKNEKGYVNADLLQSKDGKKLYFAHNDYKPAQKSDTGVQSPDEEVNPEDIPF